MLLLTALAALTPAPATVDVQVLGLEERRTQNPVLQNYERLRVSMVNRGGDTVSLRLCPEDAASDNFWLNGERSAPTARAFAASVGTRSWRTSCQRVPIAPGQARQVTYFIRGENRDVRAQRRELRLTTNVGAYRFELPSRAGASAAADPAVMRD